MKSYFFKQAFLAVVSSAMLVSCGGGGDIAGDGTEFDAVPEKFTLSITSAVENDCSAARGEPWSVISIVGGQPPFRIINSDPARLEVDRTEATGKDPQFKVRPTGYACGEIVVSVLDYHSKLATHTYKVESKKAAATTP